MSPYEEALQELMESKRKELDHLLRNMGHRKQITKTEHELATLETRLRGFRKSVESFRHRPATTTRH